MSTMSRIRRSRRTTPLPQTRNNVRRSIALYSGATRNGDPWPAPGFPSQSPKRSDRLGTKPLHHDTVAGPRRVVVVVVVVVVVLTNL